MVEPPGALALALEGLGLVHEAPRHEEQVPGLQDLKRAPGEERYERHVEART